MIATQLYRGGSAAAGARTSAAPSRRIVENAISLPDGHRFDVRRCAGLLLDIRNKRDVVHLGADVDVNRMDAELVLRLCSWTLAEMVREFGQADPETAQTLIDKIPAEQMPWIEKVDGDSLVLAKDLSAANRTLVALHDPHPSAVSITALRAMVGYKNSSEFKRRRTTHPSLAGGACARPTSGLRVERHRHSRSSRPPSTLASLPGCPGGRITCRPENHDALLPSTTVSRPARHLHLRWRKPLTPTGEPPPSVAAPHTELPDRLRNTCNKADPTYE